MKKENIEIPNEKLFDLDEELELLMYNLDDDEEIEKDNPYKNLYNEDEDDEL